MTREHHPVRSPLSPNRRSFLGTGLFGVATAAGIARAEHEAADVSSSELDEVTIGDLTAGLASRKWTARGLVERYLARIEAIDRRGPALRSVIEVNPDALSIA